MISCTVARFRFYDPAEGKIKLDGRDIRELNVGWLRSQVRDEGSFVRWVGRLACLSVCLSVCLTFIYLSAFVRLSVARITAITPAPPVIG